MIVQIINTLYTAFMVVLFARIILSWVRVSPYDQTWGPLVQFVYQITEPLLAPIRNILPSAGGLDFSPIILLFGAQIIRNILLSFFI